MTELFLDQIRERNSGDKAAMAEAFDNLNRMVGKHISTEGNTTDKNQGATAHDPNNADLSRTLPERRLTVRDILVFAMKSITLRDIMFIIIACAIVTALTMLTPYLNKQIFDDVIPSGEISNVLPIAIVLAATGIGAVLFGVTRNLLLLRIRDKVDVALQAAIMSRTYRLPVDFFRNYSPGDLGGRVMSVSTLCAILSDNVLSGILTIIFSLSYLYQIFVYAQSLLPLSLLLIMANITLIIASYWVNARFNSSIQPRLTKLSGTLFSFINGIQKIKTSGSETRAFAQWVKSYQHADPNNSSKPLFIALVPVYSILINMGGTALIYTLVIQNHIALSDYIAFNVAYGEIVGAITTVSILLPSLVQIKPLFDLLKPILETVPEIEPETTKIDDLTGRIEIHDLKFRYSESTPYIIDGLSLTINPGEYIAIVGGSGSGKSTLIRLLLGFEKPESGNIFYDHYNLQKLNKRELRQKLIGTSLQDGKLFGGSIFENITVTAPFATHEEAWEAARLADIADDIEEMPMKMHTIINENGTGVSGGQRQRILIARALVCKPKILIMDEATSALDNIRQERVTNNINSTHCTRICIAHRLSTIRKCDRIIFLEKGRIAEEGTYEQLIEKKGKFYELTQRQML